MQVICQQKAVFPMQVEFHLITMQWESMPMILMVICILLTVITTDALENILEIQMEIIQRLIIGNSTHTQDITTHWMFKMTTSTLVDSTTHHGMAV